MAPKKAKYSEPVVVPPRQVPHEETFILLHGRAPWADKDEIASTPGGVARNVVLVGLSQGCAASLVSLLLWEGAPLGAMAGICEWWLPFCARMREQLDGAASGGVEEEDDVYGGRQLDLVFRDVPVFLGHGVEDNRAHVSLGRDAAGLLGSIGQEPSGRSMRRRGIGTPGTCSGML
ncbi:hypothetical protein MAPG_11172 [Magnaporthiopsis poae ATCC 64411]|uniref:Phospholipase/carboxylesterase/thioesterase domain-containing protein n=1 Tax=Magnaporthiopsis poae (strain ATCC 64411 / 73-15) TaxID=644358 RepID=A0A0C4EEJ9_MAGP6|nr:hypothetical protein MAPG_11172 [Magnaporthiopsis poae ATCC 64411]